MTQDVNEGLSYIVIQNDMGHAYTFLYRAAGLGFGPRIPCSKGRCPTIERPRSTIQEGLVAQIVYLSGGRDLNPRPLPWQGSILPLNYRRDYCIVSNFALFVPMGRLGLPNLAAYAPEAYVSTNSTTSASRQNYSIAIWLLAEVK